MTRRLAAELRSAGFTDPVLVVADDPAVARLAPTWAAAFAEAGWTHRVLVCAGVATRRAIDAIAAEARAFGAAVVVGSGGGDTLAATRHAAAACRRPFVACPTGAAHAGAAPPIDTGPSAAIPADATALVVVDTDVTGTRPSGGGAG